MLTVGYLAGQLAAVPHAHGQSGDSQPSDHSARPHVHFSWFDCHDHSHDDHSQDDGHTHHHERDGTDSQPPSSESNAGHDDHDSDAVYLPNDTGISLPSKSVGSPDSLQVVSTLVIAAVNMPAAVSECLAGARPPGKCSPDCPLYLALRALRI
jgi:hypothetical protein